MVRICTGLVLSFALAACVGSVSAQPPTPPPPTYGSIALPVGSYIYTADQGMLNISADYPIIGLRLEQSLVGGTQFYTVLGKLYAAAEFTPKGSKQNYKGWIFAVNFGTDPKKPPQYVFVSNEPTKPGGERYPIYYAYHQQDDWHFAFDALRAAPGMVPLRQPQYYYRPGEGPKPLFYGPGDGPKGLNYCYGSDGPMPLTFYSGGDGPMPLFYGPGDGPTPLSRSRGILGRVRCR